MARPTPSSGPDPPAVLVDLVDSDDDDNDDHDDDSQPSRPAPSRAPPSARTQPEAAGASHSVQRASASLASGASIRESRSLEPTESPRSAPALLPRAPTLPAAVPASLVTPWMPRSGDSTSDSSFEAAAAPGACPFFKRVPGTPFVVDGFKWAHPALARHYILTHFHSDHYFGLRASFSAGHIYCTPSTAALVRLKLGVKAEFLRPIPLDTPVDVEGTEVTFLDANHCPGSAMALLRSPSGSTDLHVGDFRWDDSVLLRNPTLRALTIAGGSASTHSSSSFSFSSSTSSSSSSSSSTLGFSSEQGTGRLDSLYLDTTYCDARYRFPAQAATVEAVAQAAAALAADPTVLFLFGTYTIGKERLFLEVARRLKEKVFVDRAKRRILDCLDWAPEDRARLTDDPGETRIHVVPLGYLNLAVLRERLQREEAAWRADATADRGGRGVEVGVAVRPPPPPQTKTLEAYFSVKKRPRGDDSATVAPSAEDRGSLRTAAEDDADRPRCAEEDDLATPASTKRAASGAESGLDALGAVGSPVASPPPSVGAESPARSPSLSPSSTPSESETATLGRGVDEELSAYAAAVAARSRRPCRSIVAFRPTGWTYRPDDATLAGRQRERAISVGADTTVRFTVASWPSASSTPGSAGSITIFGVPYSEHSSFRELRRCVAWLQPKRIIPTVNCRSAAAARAMEALLRAPGEDTADILADPDGALAAALRSP